jgi:hypothetical protein
MARYRQAARKARRSRRNTHSRCGDGCASLVEGAGEITDKARRRGGHGVLDDGSSGREVAGLRRREQLIP